MNDELKKEDFWIRKLPVIIVVLAVLIFLIAAFTDHNQYIKLSGKVKQTGTELDQLKSASGSLQEVTNKLEARKQQVAGMTAELEKLTAEKNGTDAALSRLRQEMSEADQELTELNGQVSAGRDKVAELTKESEILQSTLALRNNELEKTNELITAATSHLEGLYNTAQRLEGDIVNKKSVLDAIDFLQRQRPLLEEKIEGLKSAHDLAAQAAQEQRARLDALQKETQEAAAVLQAQNEQRTALSQELAELAETIKSLSSQKENLELLNDQQKKLAYLENLQQQKTSMEIAINNLLQQAKMLEEKSLNPQPGDPAPR